MHHRRMGEPRITLSGAFAIIKKQVDAIPHFELTVEDDGGFRVGRIKLKGGQAVGSITLPLHFESSESHVRALALQALGCAAKEPATRDYVQRLQRGT